MVPRSSHLSDLKVNEGGYKFLKDPIGKIKNSNYLVFMNYCFPMIFCKESNIGCPLSSLSLLKTDTIKAECPYHYHTAMTLNIITDQWPHYIRRPQIAKGMLTSALVLLETLIPCRTETRKSVSFAQYCS